MNTERFNTVNRIQIAAEKIAQAQKPVSFSGAGLSAESGISTFRDKSDDALWRKFNPAELASQEGFKANPEMVINWYNARRKTAASARPNAAHCTLGSQTNWIHITQNVDLLLEAGGAADERVLHLHGTLDKDHCNGDCGYSEQIDMHAPPGLRTCTVCGTSMRPSVVWFGETLPQAIFEAAVTAIEQSDLLLVVGTSAQVVPASGLIDLARGQGASIIVVNTESSTNLSVDDIELIGKAGQVLPQLFPALTT